MTSVSVALRTLRQAFREAGLASPDLDARLLVEHLTGLDALAMVRDPDKALTAEQVAKLEDARQRRLAGEPVHRILGFRAFRGLKLMLSPETLEPRPDTEVLVDTVLPFLRERIARQGSARVLDLGTGTGAIALALLAELPGLTATATDISDGALDTARGNAHINGIADRFETLRSDWLDAVHGTYDAIVSNPPYIETAEIAQLSREVVEHDPRRALDGGEDGLDAYRTIARDAGRHLAEDGRIAVEIGWKQGTSVRAAFESAGYQWISTVEDLAGHDRVLIFRQHSVL